MSETWKKWAVGAFSLPNFIGPSVAKCGYCTAQLATLHWERIDNDQKDLRKEGGWEKRREEKNLSQMELGRIDVKEEEVLWIVKERISLSLSLSLSFFPKKKSITCRKSFSPFFAWILCWFLNSLSDIFRDGIQAVQFSFLSLSLSLSLSLIKRERERWELIEEVIWPGRHGSTIKFAHYVQG